MVIVYALIGGIGFGVLLGALWAIFWKGEGSSRSTPPPPPDSVTDNTTIKGDDQFDGQLVDDDIDTPPVTKPNVVTKPNGAKPAERKARGTA